MPITGNLLIEWTSNYSIGCHRIGYRLQGAGSYTLIDNIATPYCNPGIAQSCAYSIGPLSFENESCDDVVYEYYVQPCCENPVSEDGRVYGTITFTPTPSCIAVDFICNNVGIASVSVSNNGGGTYTPGTGYTVAAGDIIGGGGSGTTITFDVDGEGNVNNANVTVSGSGYTSTPVINITTLSGAGGNDTATLTVVMELCPDFALTDTCDNPDAGTTIETLLGSSFSVCYTGGLTGAPVPPTNYTTIEDPALCCYDCVILQIQPPISPLLTATSMYIDCTTGLLTTVALTNVSGSINTCAKRDSWTTDSTETIFVQGPVCLPS
jgi:hypothetical protein